MSNTVDQRIVDMQFNNKQFETGIKDSLGSLDKLKKGLDLDGATKSLSNLGAVSSKFSLAGISAGIETISSRFSMMGMVGVTALMNITNSAVNAGKQLVKSLTVDPIMMGFSEYETKMGAITTILTNTASKGTKLPEVTAALGELNDYSDKTIYNFAEMARNVGTFTAAGVDLKTSVAAIKGIANLAAGSGSTSAQASTAMYQLSQALAAGSMKLMDWNSVVNAGMGGELFQNALKATAKEMGIVVDQSVPFRNSLESGWLSSKVLTTTLNKFATDASLVEAATQVKTVTQLLSTMKESVQSGWAQSWEAIIGDKDEAAKILTAVNNAFGNIAGGAAAARNEMLEFWKANGGRDAIITAISNSFNALQTILKPIGEAFRELFPPTTGRMLVDISTKIRDFTERFKMGELTLLRVKLAFKGVFALLDLGRQVFHALGLGVRLLKENFDGMGGGLLLFAAKIGYWLVKLNDSVRASGVLGFFVGDVVRFIEGGVKAIINIIKTMVDAIMTAATFVHANVTTIVTGFKNLLNIDKAGLSALGDVVKTATDSIKAGFQKIVDFFKSFGQIDMSGLDSFTTNVQTRFEPLTAIVTFVGYVFNKIVGLLTKAVPLIMSIARFVGRAFSTLSSSITDAFNNAEFKGLFDTVNAGLFAGLLVGIVKFVKSLTSMTDGVGGSLKEIGGSAKGFLKGITGVLDGVRDSLKAYQAQIKATTLLTIAIAVGILAAALIALSLVDSEKLTGALAAITVLFAELAVTMKMMLKSLGGAKGLAGVSAAMIGMSMAVLILAIAVKKLGEMDATELTKGTLAIGVLTGVLVTAAKILSQNTGAMIKGAFGFVLFAGAIVILTTAVRKLSELNIAQLAKGLIGVGVLVAELAVFMKIVEKTKMSVSSGIGLIMLGIAINILAAAVEKFGNLSSNQLIKGLGAMAIVLTELALFVNLTGDAKKVVATATGLTILGAAMLIFAEVLERMGSLSIEQLVKGLGAMGIVLAELVLAMRLMPKDLIIKGAGLVAIASALLILADVLAQLGAMSMEAIGKGLLAMAGSLTLIVIAMKFMTTALPGAFALLVISAALMMLVPVLRQLGAMSLKEIGLALLALAGVFVVLGVAALVLAPLTPVIFSLAASIFVLGVAITAIGGGLLLFSMALGALAISGAAGVTALVAIAMSLIGIVPMLLGAFAAGVIAFVKVLGDGAPIIGEALKKIFIAIFDVIVTLTPPAVEAIMVFLKGLLDAIVGAIPLLVDAGLKLIIGLLRGISDNIQGIVEAGIDIVVNFVKGIASKLPAIIDSAFALIIGFINGLADAIRNNDGSIYNACSNLVNAIIESIGKLIYKFGDVGKNIIDGIISGFRNMGKKLVDAATGVVQNAIDGVKRFLGIASPSKVFAEIGKFSMAGMANGLTKFGGGVVSAATDVGSNIVDTLGAAMSNIPTLLDGNIDMAPTIRPVVDLTGVQAGATAMDSMLNKDKTISVEASASKAEAAAKSQTDRNQLVNDIKKGMSDLRDSVTSAFDKLVEPVPQINFNGTYQFANEGDIDYFMNAAALLVQRRKG